MQNFKKLILTVILIAIIGWILFNPYIYHLNSEFISSFSVFVNNFFESVGLNYRFSSGDILNSLRFLEYFIFGVFSAILCKIYLKNVWLNIMNPLFLGLITATLEIYFRNFGVYKLEVSDILISFLEFCAGLLIIICFRVSKPKKIFSSKYKKSKYAGRN